MEDVINIIIIIIDALDITIVNQKIILVFYYIYITFISKISTYKCQLIVSLLPWSNIILSLISMKRVLRYSQATCITKQLIINVSAENKDVSITSNINTQYDVFQASNPHFHKLRVSYTYVTKDQHLTGWRNNEFSRRTTQSQAAAQSKQSNMADANMLMIRKVGQTWRDSSKVMTHNSLEAPLVAEKVVLMGSRINIHLRICVCVYMSVCF